MPESIPSAPTASGYAPVNGLEMYWESRGSGGTPLIVTPGGYGVTTMFGGLLDELAQQRQVISVELQGHGHTGDIDRRFDYASFGDDIAALVTHLGLGQVDLFGHSLGGGASLRATIQHPDLVRRLVLLSAPLRRDGWLPDVLIAMKTNNRANVEQFRQSPMYAAWAAVAPDLDAFPTVMDKVGELLATPYDWTEDVRKITAPTQLIFADADSIGTAHMAEFFNLLGGGLRDGNWDGSAPTEMRLAILPGRTHYNAFAAPRLADIITEFLV
jgi:pimeloyl-ACP methyl ester carboxylesterase